MLGVTASAWARELGAVRVIVCDTDPGRRALAGTFGATHVADPEGLDEIVLEATEGYGVEAAFELTGAPEAFEVMLPLTRLGGALVLVGSVFPSRPVPIALEQLVCRCLTLRGVHNYAPRHLQAALTFLETSRQFPFEDLVDDWQPLSLLARALSEPVPSDKLRIGIRPI